jgi:RNA polymerase sigma factor (sigma-70 family)
MDDVEAFRELYRRDAGIVLVFLTRRTWDGEIALELTAETFAIALESWQRLAPLLPEQQRAWLFTVARRLFSRYCRRARVERRAIDRLGMQLPQVQHDDLAEIEHRAGLPELRSVLAEQLSRLSSGQRETLQLRVVEERSYEEVARLLGISEQSARTRVSRALRTMSDGLDRGTDQDQARSLLSGDASWQEGSG